jgi:hypothetical protein
MFACKHHLRDTKKLYTVAGVLCVSVVNNFYAVVKFTAPDRCWP